MNTAAQLQRHIEHCAAACEEQLALADGYAAHGDAAGASVSRDTAANWSRCAFGYAQQLAQLPPPKEPPMETPADSPEPRYTDGARQIARRFCQGGIQITSTIATSMFITDSEARNLIEQLQVALSIPAPAQVAEGRA